MESILTTINVDKQYGDAKVLDHISIDVPRGSIYGLLGPNGAGKTSLIRIINQITAPDSGEIHFMGRRLQRDDIALIGYLPEERGLYRKMKVGEQMLYLARLKGLSHAEAHRQINIWFEKFGIQTWWHRKVEELSKGMQQKIQFIATVLHRPTLLILDEPFSGFDPINADMLKNEILQLREQGATIVLSTHNMASVEEMCDHISLINKSRCILQGEVSRIRHAYKTGEYELCFEGDDAALIDALKADDYRITGHTQGKHNITISIQAPLQLTTKEGETSSLQGSAGMGPSGSGNDLLAKAISLVKVVSFSETLPSMNDIFKYRVSGSDIKVSGSKFNVSSWK